MTDQNENDTGARESKDETTEVRAKSAARRPSRAKKASPSDDTPSEAPAPAAEKKAKKTAEDAEPGKKKAAPKKAKAEVPAGAPVPEAPAKRVRAPKQKEPAQAALPLEATADEVAAPVEAPAALVVEAPAPVEEAAPVEVAAPVEEPAPVEEAAPVEEPAPVEEAAPVDEEVEEEEERPSVELETATAVAQGLLAASGKPAAASAVAAFGGIEADPRELPAYAPLVPPRPRRFSARTTYRLRDGRVKSSTRFVPVQGEPRAVSERSEERPPEPVNILRLGPDGPWEPLAESGRPTSDARGPRPDDRREGRPDERREGRPDDRREGRPDDRRRDDRRDGRRPDDRRPDDRRRDDRRDGRRPDDRRPDDRRPDDRRPDDRRPDVRRPDDRRPDDRRRDDRRPDDRRREERRPEEKREERRPLEAAELRPEVAAPVVERPVTPPTPRPAAAATAPTPRPETETRGERPEKAWARSSATIREMLQDEKPDISVVLRTLDGRQAVEAVLGALMRQKLLYPFEIVVLDAGSTDGTLALLEKRGIRVVSLAAHERGELELVDRALRETVGEMVVFLPQDAEPQGERWLDTLTGELLDDPKVALAEGAIAGETGARPIRSRFTRETPPPPESLFRLDGACLRRSAWEEHRAGITNGAAWLRRALAAGGVKVVNPGAVVQRLGGVKAPPTAAVGLPATSAAPLPEAPAWRAPLDIARDLVGDLRAGERADKAVGRALRRLGGFASNLLGRNK